MSRELDIQIAKSLGLDVCQCEKASAVAQGAYLVCSNSSCGKRIGRAYSRSITAAWGLVEHAEQAGYWCQMRTPFASTGEWCDGYWCGFTPHLTSGWNGTPDYWTSAGSMAEAICLAFLAWKEKADAV